MTDSDIELFLTVTTIIFAGLYIRFNVLLKKQRKVSNSLIKNRDDLLVERDKLINKLELESLKFQVSPHSLRNTLNVVKYYTETANLAVGRLTNVLDFLLYESGVDSLPLKEEVKFIKNFHELMKIRTTELVSTKFTDQVSDVPLTEKLMVPPMITAYFLENAYKHGELTRDGIININLYYDEDELIYEVENTMRQEPKDENVKGGIGLKNMKKRLDILYKDRYTLVTEPDGDIYHAKLKIKF